MAEETNIVVTGNQAPKKTRRVILTSAAQIAVTAPAAALLLSASTTPASAITMYDPGSANFPTRSANSVDTESGIDDPGNTRGDIGENAGPLSDDVLPPT